MASKELIESVQNYEDYIKLKGLDEQVLDAYSQAVEVAFEAERDYMFGYGLAKRCKGLINKFCIDNTQGDIWALERYAQDNEKHYVVIDYFYKVLKQEARALCLDSYLLYVEHKRSYKDRFYLPKRKCFLKIGLVQALQDMIDDNLDLLTISLPPGTGKALRTDTNVLTPNGWCRIGELKVGDKVISGEGRVSKVLGIYPQGKRPQYKLTLNDGTTATASDNHLWKVQTKEDRGNRKYRIVKTQDMLKNFRIENGARTNYSIDYVPKIDCFAPRSYYIHPYVMGAFLGDACINQIGISFTKGDTDMVERINTLLGDYELVHKSKTKSHEYYLRAVKSYPKERESKITKELKRLGLRGCASDTKFIPEEYKFGSYEQRLELLRGLLDTDGHTSKGNIEYSTTSPMLANDVCELVHSLGGYCSITKRKSGYKDKEGNYVRCKDSFRLVVGFSANQPNPFWLKRKADKYNPKRTIWKRYIDNIEYVGEEECVCIYISDPCHLFIIDGYILTHNTTIEKFFHSALCGWFPKDYSLFYSHSGAITRMYYDGVLNILTDSEYAWGEIFPEQMVTSTNAASEQINIGAYKPFPNLQTASVGGSNAGKVRCNLYLLVDDMISSIEEATNKPLLDKRWQQYTVDARQRKKGKCKEIHIATRWSVHDIIGRLQRANGSRRRARFISIPDVDETTGESNFNFEIDPFTTEFFSEQARLMDNVSYRCLYKNDPIEREGLLYHEEDFKYYLELPDSEPEAVWGEGDTKTSGTDYMVLPCFRQYGDMYYLSSTICDNGSDFAIQEGRIVDLMLRENMQMCEIEANAGGTRLALNVQAKVKELGGRCTITTKYTETNKETRIIVNAPWIKEHVILPDKSLYPYDSDMGRFIRLLFGYTMNGKKQLDDVPDCLANFALNQTKMTRHTATFTPIANPFRTNRR